MNFSKRKYLTKLKYSIFIIYSYTISSKNEDYLHLDDDDVEEREEENVYFYQKQAQNMKNTNRSTMFVDIDHINQFDRSTELSQVICADHVR